MSGEGGGERRRVKFACHTQHFLSSVLLWSLSVLTLASNLFPYVKCINTHSFDEGCASWQYLSIYIEWRFIMNLCTK